MLRDGGSKIGLLLGLLEGDQFSGAGGFVFGEVCYMP